jgi:catechol 2,3-dioxygenase-like lactoylglutathione lyase family enzyme
MAVQLAKSAIDLGIVITDSEKALEFYVGVLGFEHQADTPMPIGGGGTMHRLMCGDSMIKLVNLTNTPQAAAPGGIPGATGMRYFTMQVTNLTEMMAACAEAGVTIAVPESEIRPGTSIGMVEDPDGNWVEFVQTA